MAQIRVKRGHVNYIMEVGNISTGGLYISTTGANKLPWFRVGQELELDVFTTDELENLRVRGRIVRMVQDEEAGVVGFGVEFVRPDEQTRESIRGLVDQVAGGSYHPPPLPDSDKL